MLMLLSACSNKAAEAEKRLAIVKRVGTLGEVCEASRDVARAYLDQGDEASFEMADVASHIYCQSADLRGWNTYVSKKAGN
ncbi:hypothetical protein [Tsuneonella mangrovi]|uniref:hypothetical protein n=1 Tax=Tsuneonella mangrovi TaxID=1982042 RepID=UPI000BA25E7E|nr:hypothetical protein [Tsuneonella mangrovi]